MMGRPRKPTKLKILEGTFRKDREGSAPIAGGNPEKPRYLVGEASKFWDLIVPKLSELGAAAIDATVLASMCQWFAEYRAIAKDTAKAIRSGGLFLKRNLDAKKLCWREFDNLASRFGLTPADRAKLKVEPVPVSSDPMDEFLRGGGRKKA